MIFKNKEKRSYLTQLTNAIGAEPYLKHAIRGGGVLTHRMSYKHLKQPPHQPEAPKAQRPGNMCGLRPQGA